MTTIRKRWAGTYDFACHSKACAPPPAGTGGSTPGGGAATARGPLTSGKMRSLLKDEIEGLSTGTSSAYSHSVKGGGQVHSGGLNVKLLYGKSRPWDTEIIASSPQAKTQLAEKFDAIKTKLESHGYEVKPQYGWDTKTRTPKTHIIERIIAVEHPDGIRARTS